MGNPNYGCKTPHVKRANIKHVNRSKKEHQVKPGDAAATYAACTSRDEGLSEGSNSFAYETGQRHMPNKNVILSLLMAFLVCSLVFMYSCV